MGEVKPFPWEHPPAEIPVALEQLVEALRRDFEIAVRLTAVMVFSNNPAFVTVFNTERGQVVPRGEVKFSDGTTVELRDIGMCQPGTPYTTVQEVMARVWELATELGLELVK